MRDVEFGRLIGRRDVLPAIAVGLIAMGVAGIYRSAIVPTDPWHYVQGAVAFPNGTWRPAGLSRWGFLLPIVPFARAWGDATATYYAVPLLSTAALAIVLYLLGTRFVARLAGVLGALLALATPIVFVNLTRGYTDLTATTLVGLALLLATLAADGARAAQRAGQPWPWTVLALLAAAGFVTGWSFEVRETAVFAWPVIAWVLWTIGRPVRTLRWFAPPALAWLALDVILCAVVYDDPFLKFRFLAGADISQSVVTSDAGYVGHSRWWYVTILPRSLWQLSGGPVLVLCLLIGAIGGVVYRAQLGRIWAWGILAFGLLWAQGGPLDPGHPSVRLDVARYWLSFIVPLMLAAVGAVVILIRRSSGNVRLGATAVGLLLTLGILVPSVRFMTTYPGFWPNGGDAMAQLRDELTETGGMPDAVIWADWGTQRVLPTYQVGPFGASAWEARNFKSLNHLFVTRPDSPDGYPQPGSYVVVYSAEDRTCWHCRRALRPVEEAFGPFPGPGWTEVFRSETGNLTLYRLGLGVEWPILQPGVGPGGDAEDESAGEPEPEVGD